MTAVIQATRPTFADAWEKLGKVPLDRILFEPFPGTATDEDVISLHDRDNRLAELVDGILVEKPVGYLESTIAVFLARILGNYVEEHGLGVVAGEAGMMRLSRGLVRIPDVSVVLWHRLPGRRVPTEPIPDLAPDLAVEVLSKSNTAAEIQRKIGEYFNAGSQAVWLVDPASRRFTVYSSPGTFTVMAGADTVEAPSVLPGFIITVGEVFRRAGIGQD